MPRYEADITISTSVTAWVEADNPGQAARMFENGDWKTDPDQENALTLVTPYWDCGAVHDFWLVGSDDHHHHVEDEIDNSCDECGAPLDDGEGWDGLCGNCADLKEEV